MDWSGLPGRPRDEGFAVELTPCQGGDRNSCEGSLRMNLRLLVVAIALVLSAMLLGTGVYQNVVDAPNYMGAPTSLEHARGFYHATNPGMFFRWLVPATQLFLVVALLCNWKTVPVTRATLGGA